MKNIVLIILFVGLQECVFTADGTPSRVAAAGGGMFSCFGGGCVPRRLASIAPDVESIIDDSPATRIQVDPFEHKRLLQGRAHKLLEDEKYEEAFYYFKYLGDRETAHDIAQLVIPDIVTKIQEHQRTYSSFEHLSEVTDFMRKSQALVQQATNFLDFVDSLETKLLLLKYIREQYGSYSAAATEETDRRVIIMYTRIMINV